MKRIVWCLLIAMSGTMWGSIQEKPEEKKGATIIIDPGHGGVYTGTASGGLVEKHTVLAIATKVADRLRKKGYTVIMTRTTDTQLDKDDLIEDLTKRAHLAAEHKADIFVSLHLNGSLNKGSEGYEVYVPYEDQYPIKSYQLASAIHYDISHAVEPHFFGGSLGNLNRVDRGIKAARFNVLKKATCPAVLVELAYLSHAETAQKLKTDAYQNLLADAVTAGIRRYFVHVQV